VDAPLLSIAQVSRILRYARVTRTLDVYTHLFDEARHAAEIRALMAQSAFARLLAPAGSGPHGRNLVALPDGRAT
jgi:hypothetical protein